MPVDKDDVGIGWTVQTETAIPEVDSVHGQVFVKEQLPDPATQAAELGANYPEIYSRVGGQQVVLSREEALAHPGGPEPGDLETNEAYRAPVEAARAAGADHNVPEGVGEESGKAELKDEVVDDAKSEEASKSESKDESGTANSE